MRWGAGDTFLMRYRDPTDVLGGARPLRVICERNAYLVTWMPAGTRVAMPVLADGRPLRSVPLVERFKLARSTSLQPWRGPGILVLIPNDAAHSVWLFWKDDGTFWGWYVNLERKHEWNARGCDTRDHVLDVWCERPRDWEWKDSDELEEAVRHGVIPVNYAAEVRAEGERVAGVIERWDSPFSDGWEDWRPDPAWPLPELPPDWAK